MRPQSELRLTMSAALVDGPGTCRQLAQRSGWSIALTRQVLNNMCWAGDACKPYAVRVPGVRRPVPVYARAVRNADQAAPQGGAWAPLLAAWRSPCTQTDAGAMAM